jgi:tetratricopeptide (TPR) repeat protein
LDPFGGQDPATDVRAVFSWSYRLLSGDAARLFRLLGLHPGPDISPAAAASLAGVPPDTVRTLLAELTQANLVTESATDRLALHDLLRAYAAERAHAEDSDTDRHTAVHRLLDHYLHTAYAAHRIRLAEPPPVTPAPPVPGVTPECPTDQHHAVLWFTTELPVLLRAIHHAAEHGFDRHACQLGSMLTQYIGQHGHHTDQVAAQQTALAAANRLADPAAKAHAHHNLAVAHVQVHSHTEAHTHFGHAIDLFDNLNNQAACADAHLSLSHALGLQSRYAEALSHAEHGLRLYQQAGHLAGTARALATIGWHHTALGHHHDALTNSRRAIPLLQQLGNHPWEALATGNIAQVLDQLGHHDEANAHLLQAITALRNAGEHYAARGLSILGDREHAAGRPDTAHRHWHRALTLLEELDPTGADDLRTKVDSVNVE